jgi:hypothetical protein
MHMHMYVYMYICTPICIHLYLYRRYNRFDRNFKEEVETVAFPRPIAHMITRHVLVEVGYTYTYIYILIGMVLYGCIYVGMYVLIDVHGGPADIALRAVAAVRQTGDPLSIYMYICMHIYILIYCYDIIYMYVIYYVMHVLTYVYVCANLCMHVCANLCLCMC